MKVIRLFLCLFITLFVFGCDEGTEYKYFDVKNESALNQIAYLGDTQVSMPIEFTASGPWTSYVEYSTISGETAPTKSLESSEWVTLEPSSGDKAGDYSVTIKLNPEAGKDIYMAMISFVCKGEVLQVMLENNKSSNPGSIEDVDNPEKIKAAKKELESGFITIRELYYKIDADYSTPESRKSLNSKFTLLNEMWFETYKAINICNLLLYACDYGVIEGEEREQIISVAYMYRGLFYLNLATVFGGVPIYNTYPADLKLPRNEIDEVLKFSEENCEKAIELLPRSDWKFVETCFNNMWINVLAFNEQRFDNPHVIDLLNVILDNEVLEFDSNADGFINEDDSHVPVQSYLLYAYAMSSTRTEYSIEKLNKLASLLGNSIFSIDENALEDEIKQKVVSILSNNWNRGIKYYVNTLMINNEWGDLKLLPIPLDAMSSNENLIQNPGWN